MKVVILAAGKGSRLGDSSIPKPLTLLVDGKSILQHQIESVSQVLSLHDIFIVVGFHKELIMDAFPNLLFVYNPDFDQENTSKSLLKAINKIEDDILWINGDVVFHPGILKKLIQLKKNAMVVNIGEVGKEEVKYRTDPQGMIVEVSKQVEDAEGEALGINLICKKDLDLFRKHLELCQKTDYFEKAIETAIQEGLKIGSLAVQKSECTEIDFPQDLQNANLMIQNWQKR